MRRPQLCWTRVASTRSAALGPAACRLRRGGCNLEAAAAVVADAAGGRLAAHGHGRLDGCVAGCMDGAVAAKVFAQVDVAAGAAVGVGINFLNTLLRHGGTLGDETFDALGGIAGGRGAG